MKWIVGAHFALFVGIVVAVGLQWDHFTDTVTMRLEHDETLVGIDSDRILNAAT